MSTRITVTSSSDALLASARQVQQANREAQLQRERDARVEATTTAEVQATTLQPSVGGNPDTSIDRRPSAQRDTLSPFAISWKGVFTGGYDSSIITILDTYEVVGLGTRYDIITTEYTGGRLLSPSPVRISSSKALASSNEVPRYESWRSNVITCRTTSDPDGGAACLYTPINNRFPGRWLTAARAEIPDPWLQVTAAPELDAAVGPIDYHPSTSTLTVAANGTVFLVFDLPDEPQILTAMPFPEYADAGYPENTIVTEDDVDIDYSFAYDPFYGQTARIQLKKVRRYIFIKSQNGSMQSKVINRPDGQELKDFLYANAYPDDPSRAVRQAGYLGEYRVNGTTAKFLQLKSGSKYTAFPFGFLSAYRQEGTDLPVLTDDVTFEDHTHTINSSASAAELKAQLESLANANAPATAPLSKRKLRIAPNFFVRAKARLGSDVGEQLTPYLFVVVAP